MRTFRTPNHDHVPASGNSDGRAPKTFGRNPTVRADSDPIAAMLAGERTVRIYRLRGSAGYATRLYGLGREVISEIAGSNVLAAQRDGPVLMPAGGSVLHAC